MALPPTPPADLRALFASRMVRLFACGLLAVILVLHLRAIGLGAEHVGWLLMLTSLVAYCGAGEGATCCQPPGQSLTYG